MKICLMAGACPMGLGAMMASDMIVGVLCRSWCRRLVCVLCVVSMVVSEGSALMSSGVFCVFG